MAESETLTKTVQHDSCESFEPNDEFIDQNAKQKRSRCNNILFNVGVGQIIAIGMVSGGIFT